MKTFYLPLVLTVGGGLLYHVGIKSLSASANPFVPLLASAACLAAVYAICGFAASADNSPFAALRASGWGVLAIAVGAASIELGFLWAYRQGWNISRASLTTSVSVTLLLAAIGLLFFKERLTPWNVLGVMLCAAGLILVTRAE